jgi:hypothetical protein
LAEVVRYDVLEAPAVDDLISAVQDRIARGWQPLGGPFAVNGLLLQAVVWTDSAESSVIGARRTHTPGQDNDLLDELTEDDSPHDDWQADLLRRTSG